ncbi:hypothetical protein SKAU_G00191150 [Synaphobranchus kaupii]|uniref:Uncharacterized protein n=1 Tax=Synaphobranchus kaupii TaxID=118154 RepID=A0A9Q1IWV9_SYNKA|nr:hypothetical protein SKAU_G00191150 [Synaphobranchus kaupii]
MNKLGRNAWIGLGVGATAGISLILFLVIYKKMKRTLCQSLSLPSNSDAPSLTKDGPSSATVPHVLEVQAGSSLEALAIRPKPGLLVEQQVELKNRLDELHRSSRTSRMAWRRARRWRVDGDPRRGERFDSVSSSSVYFTASSRYDGESEGGTSRYTTANTESDCNGEAEKETKKDAVDEEDEEDEEDKSHVTECTLRQDSSDTETEEEEAFSDAESPGDAEAPPLSRCGGVPSGGALDEGQGPQLCCPNRGLDVDGTSPEAQKPVKDEKGALISRGKQ